MTSPGPFALPAPLHGGPDAAGIPLFDFSTNSNACGPCPEALHAVQAADATRYPDPSYKALREALGAFHGVAPGRIVLAGSASEFIHRITALAMRRGARCVAVPVHGYGDYAQAARAWGLAVQHAPQAGAALQWACVPSSPLGQDDAALTGWLQAGVPLNTLCVLDCAYHPLRLEGPAPGPLDAVWQLWTPNKALGLTGVRAAYAIAPRGSEDDAAQLDAMAASWVVGAHGEAMLLAWTQGPVQQWLENNRALLRRWKARQLVLLQSQGWTCQPSGANFFCAQPPHALDLAALRAAGIKLRDATSFGLLGWYRLGVLAPQAQDALLAAVLGPGR